jgi:hypothetical protein
MGESPAQRDMRQPIPDDVRRFILASVPSIPFLEAMLLMRAEPQAQWDAAAIARRLYIPAGRGEELVAQLAEAGLAASTESGLRWQPEADLGGVVDRLAALYAEDLVGVTELIHSRQERRAQQFADAFRLRKKEE